MLFIYSDFIALQDIMINLISHLIVYEISIYRSFNKNSMLFYFSGIVGFGKHIHIYLT